MRAVATGEVLLTELRSRVRRELLAHGCPEPVATRLAGEVLYEPAFSISMDAQDRDPLLSWRGAGVGLEHPDDPDEAAWAVLNLVENIVDDNAEAHDRSLRAEPGYEPLWPLPDRKPRHR